MPGVRAVLFDLDDTLYPESAFVQSGFQAVARWGQETHGLPEATSFERLWALFRDGVRGNTFDLWLADPGLVQQAVAVYRAHAPEIRPFPEVPGLLEELGSSHRLGIVTDGEPGMQERKLAALGIGASFGAVLCTGSLGPEWAKLSPRPFEVVLDRLGVSPESAWYIGDNPLKDFLGARRAGVRTVRVQRPEGIYTGQAPPTPDHRPDHVLLSLEGLRELLDSSWSR